MDPEHLEVLLTGFEIDFPAFEDVFNDILYYADLEDKQQRMSYIVESVSCGKNLLYDEKASIEAQAKAKTAAHERKIAQGQAAKYRQTISDLQQEIAQLRENATVKTTADELQACLKPAVEEAIKNALTHVKPQMAGTTSDLPNQGNASVQTAGKPETASVMNDAQSKSEVGIGQPFDMPESILDGLGKGFAAFDQLCEVITPIVDGSQANKDREAISELKEQIAQLLGRPTLKSGIKEDLRALKGDLGYALKTIHEQVAALMGTTTAGATNVGALETEYGALKTEFGAFQTKLGTFHTELGALKRDFNDWLRGAGHTNKMAVDPWEGSITSDATNHIITPVESTGQPEETSTSVDDDATILRSHVIAALAKKELHVNDKAWIMDMVDKHGFGDAVLRCMKDSWLYSHDCQDIGFGDQANKKILEAAKKTAMERKTNSATTTDHPVTVATTPLDNDAIVLRDHITAMLKAKEYSEALTKIIMNVVQNQGSGDAALHCLAKMFSDRYEFEHPEAFRNVLREIGFGDEANKVILEAARKTELERKTTSATTIDNPVTVASKSDDPTASVKAHIDTSVAEVKAEIKSGIETFIAEVNDKIKALTMHIAGELARFKFNVDKTIADAAEPSKEDVGHTTSPVISDIQAKVKDILEETLQSIDNTNKRWRARIVKDIDQDRKINGTLSISMEEAMDADFKLATADAGRHVEHAAEMIRKVVKASLFRPTMRKFEYGINSYASRERYTRDLRAWEDLRILEDIDHEGYETSEIGPD
ncbi:hypothetical protein MBLNU457_g0321t1 [Dothideomycetes sp. NU457]